MSLLLHMTRLLPQMRLLRQKSPLLLSFLPLGLLPFNNDEISKIFCDDVVILSCAVAISRFVDHRPPTDGPVFSAHVLPSSRLALGLGLGQ